MCPATSTKRSAKRFSGLAEIPAHDVPEEGRDQRVDLGARASRVSALAVVQHHVDELVDDVLGLLPVGKLSHRSSPCVVVSSGFGVSLRAASSVIHAQCGPVRSHRGIRGGSRHARSRKLRLQPARMRWNNAGAVQASLSRPRRFRMSTLATPEGTQRYADENGEDLRASRHFRTWPAGRRRSGPFISPASGSAPTPARPTTPATGSIVEAVSGGGPPRHQRDRLRHQLPPHAQRAGPGRRPASALRAPAEAARDEVFVMSKGGYLPFDGEVPENVGEYFRRTYLDSGIALAGGDRGGPATASPRAFWRISSRAAWPTSASSRSTCYFLHNVEQQLEERRRGVRPPGAAAFTFLEGAVAGRTDRLLRRGHLERLPRPAGVAGAPLPGEAARDRARGRRARSTTSASCSFRTTSGMPEALDPPTQELEGQARLPAGGGRRPSV